MTLANSVSCAAQTPPFPAIDCFAISHPGRVRPINEDRFLARPDAGLWVVADGMGGLAHGDIAAATIVRTLSSFPARKSHHERMQDLAALIGEANDYVMRIAQEQRAGMMGSTLAALLLTGGCYSAVWCGDSRVFRIHDGAIACLTSDHSEAQQLVDCGLIEEEEAQNSPRKHVLLHAIGVAQTPHVETVGGRVFESDVFLLCTDGVTNEVSADELRELVEGRSAEAACAAILELVLDRGARDNATIVVVRHGHCRQMDQEKTIMISVKK